MSTIYEIAAQVGVSTATVSRVINKRRGVNKQTVAKIEQALDEARFRPRWKAAPENVIGLVIAPYSNCLADVYNANAISALCETLFAEGYTVHLIPCIGTHQTLGDLRKMAMSHQLQGVVILNFHYTNDLSDLVDESDIPHVIIGNAGIFGAKNHVSVDDRAGGLQAMRYLALLGHRHIGVVTASARDRGQSLRLQGVRDAAEEIGDVRIVHRAFEEFDSETGVSAAAELMSVIDRPTAIVVTNSTLAMGFVRGCRRMGVGVPGEVSILGFEDGDELSNVDPPITAMRQPTRQVGQEAAWQLIKQLRAVPVETHYDCALTLLVRETTARVSQ
ncbi:MAG: LacI family DNA-binding transcriptional regulator [Capsulimonadaceae bacterium]|nr:LacI family DNA-binding transcriptional regulator [Capsulimonadaceae bacterium]